MRQEYFLFTEINTMRVSCCRCLSLDATDGRTYVALGKLFVQQRRYDEARSMYEEGSTATGAQRSPYTKCTSLDMKMKV